MEIKRFDDVEFKAIQCGNSGGYYSIGSPEAERALLLMKEGVYQHNPVSNWSHSGWQFTEWGKKYYQEFMKAVQEKHRHVWLTRRERNPEDYKEDSEYGDSIDIFALSEGYHNGPECKNCGFSFCQHCKNEMDIPECKRRTK